MSAEGPEPLTNPAQFHPQCRPEEVFDPKSGSCVPTTNIGNTPPRGTLECPPGFVIDENKGLCVPEGPLSQAQYKPDAKAERCIMDVKDRLRKKNPKMEDQKIKSAAIAICRSRLGK